MSTFNPIRLTRVETTEIQDEAVDKVDFTPSPNQLTEDLDFGIYLYEVLHRSLDATPQRTLALVLGYRPEGSVETTNFGGDRWPLAFRLTVESDSLHHILQTALINISPVGRIKSPDGSLHRLSQIVRSGEIQLILGALDKKEILQSIPISTQPISRDGYFLCIVSTEPYLTLSTSVTFLLIEGVKASTLKSVFRSTKFSETLPTSLLMRGHPFFVTEHGALSVDLNDRQDRHLKEDPTTFLARLGLDVSRTVATSSEVASWLIHNDQGAALAIPNRLLTPSNVTGRNVIASLPFRRLFFDFVPSQLKA